MTSRRVSYGTKEWHELVKRSDEGWEFVSSHYETGGSFSGNGRHVLIFRRKRAEESPT